MEPINIYMTSLYIFLDGYDAESSVGNDDLVEEEELESIYSYLSIFRRAYIHGNICAGTIEADAFHTLPAEKVWMVGIIYLVLLSMA